MAEILGIRRLARGILVAGFLAGCGSTGTARSPLIADESLFVSKSLTIPAESAILGAAVFFIVDPLAPNWQVEAQRIDEDRFRISLRRKRFSAGGDGEAAQVFQRQAEKIARDGGFAGYQVIEYTEGIESALPVAQRVSQGVIRVTRAFEPRP